MAATGSGKTTQVPQIILDDYIARGEGSSCNIICTQPRRLAAISVAQRVANERNENVGDTVGYQARYENQQPRPHGSMLFCTTGIFLKRLQGSTDNTQTAENASSLLDKVSHVIIDEVHERDVNIDLLLFVLRREMQERKKAGKPNFKVILM